MPPSGFTRPQVPHFYRYGRLDTEERRGWLQSLLLRHELYVPTAKELNDLREARPRLSRKTADEIRSFWRWRISEDHPDLSRAELEDKWRRIDEAIEGLGVDVLLEETRSGFHGLLERYRIYSMSKRWDNLSMWQWYGDQHRGYCLEFQNLSFKKAVREVVYSDEITFDWIERSHSEELLFTKHRDWSNEEEVRLVLPPRLGGPVFTLNPHAILRVILGKDVAPAHATEVREWCERRDPSLPVVTTKWDAFDAQLVIV